MIVQCKKMVSRSDHVQLAAGISKEVAVLPLLDADLKIVSRSDDVQLATGTDKEVAGGRFCTVYNDCTMQKIPKMEYNRCFK